MLLQYRKNGGKQLDQLSIIKDFLQNEIEKAIRTSIYQAPALDPISTVLILTRVVIPIKFAYLNVELTLF